MSGAWEGRGIVYISGGATAAISSRSTSTLKRCVPVLESYLARSSTNTTWQ